MAVVLLVAILAGETESESEASKLTKKTESSMVERLLEQWSLLDQLDDEDNAEERAKD